MSLIFRVGIDNEKITRNPAAGIKRKTENNDKVRFLSDEEERALLRVTDPRFHSHLLLSIHTGIRMSEQYSLKWSQIDFGRRQMYLAKTNNGDPHDVPLTGQPFRHSNNYEKNQTETSSFLMRKVREAGSWLPLSELRLKAIRGIAIAILSPVDWSWPV